MSLLTIIQEVADILGVRRPTAVAVPTTEGDRLWLGIAKEANRFLANNSDWWELAKRGTVTLATGVEGYSLPSDFDRFLPDTMYQDEDGEQQLFPVSRSNYASIQWGRNTRTIPFAGVLHYIKSGTSGGSDVRGSGPQLLLQPVPTADHNGRDLDYWYVVNTLAVSSGSIVKANFAVDTDLPILPEHLIKLGIIWRYKQMKGYEYSTDKSVYESEVRKHQGFNRASRKLNMSSESTNYDRSTLGLTISDRGY